MHSQFFIDNGQRIHYLKIGQGHPLFLVHGYQADSSVFCEMASSLSNYFTVIILDLPGHGKSPLIKVVNDMEFLADLIFKLTLALGYREISIAGHSLGGYVALAFANKYSNFTEKVFLINSHPFEDTLNKLIAREREAQLIENGKLHLLLHYHVKNNFSISFQQLNTDAIKIYTEMVLRQSASGMLADIAGMMARPDKYEVYKKLRDKPIVVLGEDDKTLPDHLLESLCDSDYSIEFVKACGHMGIIEKGLEITALIRKYF